jgi:hypothetical protein
VSRFKKIQPGCLFRGGRADKTYRLVLSVGTIGDKERWQEYFGGTIDSSCITFLEQSSGDWYERTTGLPAFRSWVKTLVATNVKIKSRQPKRVRVDTYIKAI